MENNQSLEFKVSEATEQLRQTCILTSVTMRKSA